MIANDPASPQSDPVRAVAIARFRMALHEAGATWATAVAREHGTDLSGLLSLPLPKLQALTARAQAAASWEE
ncbi:conserved protein of unknown function [Rhodovastum atsumiense]|uniref:Uncharacterized protein n=1 Tax=Rhodovastum atsumiense TaxID=504468 RepID=A0A5M6INM5_9PROT|nr:hypothetical protein [Rhodovastum atsumiense]KAA5609864.1 hypothetical protein F1189_21995 [Rhodovastum atsumiense]CAH2602436.1 conserved protein of unknown function [Rhodovastum atsumiense]